MWTLLLLLLANVNVIRYMLSPFRLSVYNVGAPCGNFPQFFVAVWYLGHQLTSTENFTEIVPGKPLRRGFKRKRGSQNSDF